MVDAREYHERTKHTPESVRTDGYRLDRSNQPRPYKIYEDLPAVSPEPQDPPDVPTLAAIARSQPDGIGTSGSAPPVQTLCRYATGVTKTIERSGRTFRFRAASCTGKLYHVDLYAVTGSVGELDPGVYHYDPDGDAFDVLREGDYRGVLADAADDQTGVAHAPVTFVATSQWWRNAWKYRNRTYRHAFWDSGTILANLLAVAHAGGHRAEVVAGFADDPVSRLLGIDPEIEAPLELVPVGGGDPVPAATAVDPIDPVEEPLSRDPKEFPLVHEAWARSSLSSGAVEEWRERFGGAGRAFGRQNRGGGERVTLEPVDAETASARPIGDTIERRGSLREFSRDPISARKFATVLDRALGDVPVDCFGANRVESLVDVYCLVHAVEGIPQGAYQYHPGENELERIGDTDRETAGHLALDQEVVGEAAVNVYLAADVDRTVERAGNRGYRLAQLEGGIGLGRLYLATYAHRVLGGRGFTFYDDLVSEHLSPRAAEQQPMTLFAFGRRP